MVQMKGIYLILLAAAAAAAAAAIRCFANGVILPHSDNCQHGAEVSHARRADAQALAGAPRIGTALPVVQHGTRSLPREIPLPAAGAWVKLRNLAATLVDGQLQVGPS